ncbi:hypothetical protein D3C75_1287360 [compost metagenome]
MHHSVMIFYLYNILSYRKFAQGQWSPLVAYHKMGHSRTQDDDDSPSHMDSSLMMGKLPLYEAVAECDYLGHLKP